MTTVDMGMVESTAYFVRDNKTSTEILVFGDLEPDSLSLSPRNKIVWLDAAPKIKAGKLKAIFMECSWDNSQADSELYGHMKPHFVMEELQVLANLVSPPPTKDENENENHSTTTGNTSPQIKVSNPFSDISNDSIQRERGKRRKFVKPLEGITVVIIHMKEKLDDGPGIRELVRAELMAMEENMELGCTFVVSEAGMSLEF